MIVKLFAGLGVLFTALLVFTASFLGNLAFEVQAQGPNYEKLAVDITRDLSRSWSVNDVKPHYADAVAHRLGSPAAAPSFHALKPLGPLLYVDDLTHRTRWTRQSLDQMTSPTAAAEMLAELLSKAVRVTFVAKFTNGLARVTVELRSEGGAMKLWHLQIDSRDRLPPASRPSPQAISHA